MLPLLFGLALAGTEIAGRLESNGQIGVDTLITKLVLSGSFGKQTTYVQSNGIFRF